MRDSSQWRFDMRARASALFGRRALRGRLREEMEFHLAMRAEQLQKAGLSESQATAQARREFGNATVVEERTLEAWRYANVETLIRDVRYGWRSLRRTPSFTAVAVLCLALGIGANAAIFTLIDRVMLRFLPVNAPEELVTISRTFSYPQFEYFRDNGGAVFAGVLGVASLARVAVDGREAEAELAQGRLVSGEYFDVLGVKARLGRVLSSDDNRTPDGHPVIVISDAFWRGHFGSDPAVIGKTVRLGPGRLSSGVGTSGFEPKTDKEAAAGGVFTVIGVLQPGFFGENSAERPDFYAPIMMQERFMPGRPWLTRRSANWVQSIARLKPGASREQAQAAANVLLQQAILADSGGNATEEERRQAAEQKLELRDGSKGVNRLRGQFSEPLTVLMVMVGVVLLIACANLANLLLARAMARRREIGIRIAIGAARGRIVRQLVTESLLLSAMGGAAAVGVAWWATRAMYWMVAEGNNTIRMDVAPDGRTLAFTAAVSILTALIFGLAPAVRATKLDVGEVLKEGGQGASGGWAAGKVLVVAQVGLSVILLIGTGLFTRTLFKMKSQDLGYSPEQLLVMQVDPIAAGYRDDAIGTVCKQLLEKIRTLPGVQSATFSENGLFSGPESGAAVRIEGDVTRTGPDRMVRFDQVGPGYFTNVGIPILLGRDFTDADHATAERGVVINDVMAKFYFGTENPLGRRIHNEEADHFVLTVIGVAASARDHGLRDEVRRRMYVSFLQPIDGLTGANYEVRTAMDTGAMASQLRQAVRDVAPRLQIGSIRPLTTMVDSWIQRERMIAKLSILFGLMAVILASVGLYGVLAYSVSRRTAEIGVRMAIGAQPRQVVMLTVRETLVLVGVGIALGVPAALALSRYVETLLFGLKGNDVPTIAAVVGLMVIIGLAAAAGPARRAARIDPIRALRHE